MKILFIGYPPCTTCKKAYAYFKEKGYDIEYQNIKENPPTLSELKKYYKASNLPIKKLFNTSGLIYREMKLKDKLDEMSEENKLVLLSKNGMLIKRPIIIMDNGVHFGFKIKDFE